VSDTHIENFAGDRTPTTPTVAAPMLSSYLPSFVLARTFADKWHRFL